MLPLRSRGVLPFTPAIASGKTIVPVPLRPDELDVAEQTFFNKVICVVIQHAVMPLMSNSQQ